MSKCRRPVYLMGQCAALALTCSTPANADRLEQWRPFIAEASLRFGVPANWIERVMRAESAGRTVMDGRPIRSRAGAMGLMQLMPATWSDMRARLNLGLDPDDPRDNILAGTFYLRLMFERFGHPGLFAGYNAGPGRYEAYLARRVSLPVETIAYVKTVSGRGSGTSLSPARATRTALFAVSSGGAISGTEKHPIPVPSSLFVIRKDLP